MILSLSIFCLIYTYKDSNMATGLKETHVTLYTCGAEWPPHYRDDYSLLSKSQQKNESDERKARIGQ